MQCPHCQAQNREGHRFCSECGAALVLACPACGFPNDAAGKFCGGCGAPLPAARQSPEARFSSPQAYTPQHLAEQILTSRAALEGERKQVTVLFVDVSGFTALSERLDPEDVHQLMDGAFELMLAEVHRYEGTVNQFLGDGLMALFGAPLAHEDHATRAVHAALGIQRALAAYRDQLKRDRGIEFQARMGLNTGAVVVGKIGDNLRMDYSAVGDTTNLAARLLGIAEPGQVLAGEATARAVEPYFILEALGEVAVKGKALPVRAFRVEAPRAVRSRLEAVMERGLTPLVGRERELALLQERFAEVLAGRGQAVFVFGEPGIGKSRLLLEFRRQAERSGARWLTGRCVSYGRGISYLPVLDFVRDLLDIKEGDGVAAILDKIDAGVRSAGDEVVWTVPFIRGLLSLDPGDPEVAAMNPTQRRGRTVEACRALILRESQRRRVVLIVEDLHWIDSHSEEVLRLLVDSIAGTPVLVLLTYRPGYTPPFGDRTYYTRITLHGLAGAQTGAMVEGVLQAPGVPHAVRELIAQRAEGNPLFIEELSKALVEDGTLQRTNGGYRLARPASEAAIPDTIQGVIMARIDRLPESSKTALQVASVIGREFTARLVERVSAMEREAPRALGELRAVELIYETSLYPELAYMFKHALTHDVAYESLLKQRRRALHRRVGEIIEELYPDRLVEFYETLARHYVSGETWSKAVQYLLKAADKARAHYAYREAARSCEEAVEILDRLGGAAEARPRALEMLGDLHSLQGHVDPANQGYERALHAVTDPTARQRIANKRHRPRAVIREGASIAFYEHGGGQDTLLLINPIVYGLAVFQPVLEVLCQEFRIITVDARGTGASDPLPHRHTLRDHAEDARAVIEAAGGAPIVGVGISRGGNLLVHLAAAHPALLRQLVLIGAPRGHTPVAVGEFRESLTRGDVERAARIFWPTVHSEPGTRDLLDQAIEHTLRLPPHTVLSFFAEDPERNIGPLLPQVRIPTLVMHGTADQRVSFEDGRYLADHIPGARLYAFEGRGHLPLFTATREFCEVLRQFVRTGTVPEPTGRA